MRLYDHQKRPILLGEELGRGGEGSVYTIQGDTANIAKIYHKGITTEKAEKLMVMFCNPGNLNNFTAWPSATLHNQPGGSIKGFIMPRISGHREVHELYGPAHRKVSFPQADWAFLIHAARNIAAAFQSVHDYGHTIGDVNQSGILISQKALCRLIDTDSFQIRLGNKVYYCDVGTPHFTPPELQRKSFREVLRNENHDNFGLAVIIFQLLFMGRHPFAGRYLGSGDMPIERAIQEYRFAFSAKASSKQMAAPPNTLGLSVCTSSIIQLFERAFSEEAVYKRNRPNAQEWISNLDTFSRELCSCSQNLIHKYHKSLNSCPWCRLENHSGTTYFLSHISSSQDKVISDLENIWSDTKGIQLPSISKFVNLYDLNHRWIEINNIKPPSFGNLPDPMLIKVFPTPLPEYAKKPGGLIGFLNLFLPLHNDQGERKNRQNALAKAENSWKEIKTKWSELLFENDFNLVCKSINKKYKDYQKNTDKYKQELKLMVENNSRFYSIYSHLENLYNEHCELANRCKKEREQALLNIYLERFLIDRANIPNIGIKRALTLASYGIETAADISYVKIINIPSFGSVLTQNLVDWRNALASNFHKYKPCQRELISLDSIDQKYDIKRKKIEANLVKHKEELLHEREITKQKIIDHINKYKYIKNDMEHQLITTKNRLYEISENLIKRQKQILQEANNLAQKVAQARADMEVYY